MDGNAAPRFQVREYRPGDFLQLCAIDRACFAEGIAYTPDEIALGLSQPGAFVLVAEAQGQVAGFVLAYQRRQVGHIVTIDILAEYRRQGMGLRLMQLAEERLAQQGATRMVLEVSVQNEGAIRFYEGLGYAARRLLPRYYRDGTDAYLMEKTLR